MPLQRRNPRSKRPREEDTDEDGQDNDVAHESQRRRITAPIPNTTTPLKTPFACPFAKHDPRIYMKKRTCCGPGWADIGRVKYVPQFTVNSLKSPPHGNYLNISADRISNMITGSISTDAIPCPDTLVLDVSGHASLRWNLTGIQE